jgi:hypothetical protein
MGGAARLLPSYSLKVHLTFKPGKSDNPAGPPRGKPHKLTSFVRKWLRTKAAQWSRKSSSAPRSGRRGLADIIAAADAAHRLAGCSERDRSPAQIGMLVSKADERRA